MSIMRLNYLLMRNILPFNFGMDYDAWVNLWNQNNLRELIGSDPHCWTDELKEQVNQRAKDELALYNRLTALPNEEFYAECDRLAEDDRKDTPVKVDDESTLEEIESAIEIARGH